MVSCKAVGAALSLLAVVVGIVLVCTGSQAFDWVYKTELVLRPDSASFPMWQDLPAPLLAKMYLFNVTNPDKVEKGAIPEVTEIGPFTFLERHHKTKLVWNDNDTITYQQIRTWEFVPEQSSHTLDQQVTIINPVAASIGDMLRQKVAPAMRPFVDMFLKGEKEKVFVTHSANDIIFRGFDDPILTSMEHLKFILKGMVPDGAFTDKFAFFYNRNGSDYIDGVFNMYTGAGDVTKMGKVHSWNYTTHEFFPGECGAVKGGAGEFYPPRMEKTYIEMFSNDLCRSLKFEYNTTAYPEGIPTYEFVSGKNLFANGTENPENKCFNPENVYLPSGVYNTSLCRFGAPVFVSQPHFHLADPYYRSMVKGLNPDSDKHRTYLRIEPESGVPVEVTARFQLNVLIDKVPKISMYENVPRAFVPVMWFENTADVPKDMVFKMKMMANLRDILGGIGWGIFGLGVGAFIILIVRLVSRRKRREDTGPILSESLVEDSDTENVFKD